MDAIGAVIDLEVTARWEPFDMQEYPAQRCFTEDRAYLCWTASPETSVVLEYDPDAVSEEDIRRMADSVFESPQE